ncbi:MAG: hypothetical protein LLF76_02365 [Planctomycetaceae bacterium]|nr:hypothetical protein [Planctomycetaceae bacterium]
MTRKKGTSSFGIIIAMVSCIFGSLSWTYQHEYMLALAVAFIAVVMGLDEDYEGKLRNIISEYGRLCDSLEADIKLRDRAIKLMSKKAEMRESAQSVVSLN